MEHSLFIPPNWLCAWDAGINVRLACPSCGTFHLLMERHDDGRLKTLSCAACGANDPAAIQRQFYKIAGVKEPRARQIKEATA